MNDRLEKTEGDLTEYMLLHHVDRDTKNDYLANGYHMVKGQYSGLHFQLALFKSPGSDQ